MKNKKYNLVAENTQSTVVGEYVADGVRVAHYQSEADLERAFIKQLETQKRFQGWECRDNWHCDIKSIASSISILANRRANTKTRKCFK